MSTVLKPEKIREALDFAYDNKITVSTKGQDKLANIVDDVGKTVDRMVARRGGEQIDIKAIDDSVADLFYSYRNEPIAQPYVEEVLGLYKQFKAEKLSGGAGITADQANAIKRKAWVRLESYFDKASKINPSRQTTAQQDFYKAIVVR